ncbi:unnamed protein product [Paramecium sonneborni]|uniref:Uncharacterized protein n=1 Tax=Paramecium sonneborni TaxID=65129 RepID=A0A8S1QSS9_9CILI|nr:unnamed protein product [Paramecium sonneborni]
MGFQINRIMIISEINNILKFAQKQKQISVGKCYIIIIMSKRLKSSQLLFFD